MQDGLAEALWWTWIDVTRRVCQPAAMPPACVKLELLKGSIVPTAWAVGWYRDDTITVMAMTLRLTDDEHAALRERAAREGISMQDAVRWAVREYVTRGEHLDRIASAAERVKTAHAEALERLGR